MYNSNIKKVLLAGNGNYDYNTSLNIELYEIAMGINKKKLTVNKIHRIKECIKEFSVGFLAGTILIAYFYILIKMVY